MAQPCALGGPFFSTFPKKCPRELFAKATDYEAFVRVLSEALDWVDIRLLAYCVMPNHSHLVVWPERDGDLSEFMRWLTLTHTQCWHAKHELTAMRRSVARGVPFGAESRQRQTAKRLGLESSLRPVGRPSKAEKVT
jgi:REP element-mobilizing transposase RayT